MVCLFVALAGAAQAQAPDLAPPFAGRAPDLAPPFAGRAPDLAPPFAGQPPTPAELTARAALDAWQLSEADKAIATLPKGETREVLKARLQLMRSDAKGCVATLEPIVKTPLTEAGFEARVLLGRALQALGRKQEAFTTLDAMAELYNDDAIKTSVGLTWLGVGLMLTDYPKNAHRVFREALELDPGMALAKRLWADLYASKYDYRKADPLYKELGPDVMAQVGRAHVAIESDRAFTEAVELMTPLVAASPECVPCHNVLALVDLNNELPELAAKRLESQSLKVAPNDGEALGLLAAAYYLMDDAKRFAAIEKQALAANPKDTRFYRIVADHAEREHRYGEAVALLEKALALDGEDYVALGMLGTGYSRMGQDDKAKATLDAAFEGDPFNVRVYNLLAHFYDKADKRYTWVDAAPMRVRVDKVEAGVLGEVVPPLIKEAEAALTKKYGVAPELPLHIEIFKSTETFAVRSTGLPGLAAHGICFGHVITARSPSAGNFNWAEVLWHELAHVYHIQMTKGRVPRWFTEGLAVLESMEARPAWEREQDRELRAAMVGKKLRGVGDFNLAFTRAKSIGDILVAYYHAFQVTRFIRDEWGFPKMRKMLTAWGDKKTTPQVFKDSLGVDLAEFDKRFFAWLDQELGYLDRAYPFDLKVYAAFDEVKAAAVLAGGESGDPKAKAEAALLALAQGDEGNAQKWSDAALAMSDVPGARYVRALLRAKSKDKRSEAIADWEALQAANLAGVEGLGFLAAAAGEANDFRRAASLWEAAAKLEPKNDRVLMAWAAALEKAKGEVLPVWRRLLGVEQADAALAVQVLDALVKAKGSRADVMLVAEQALHIAPFDVKVQLARAKALQSVGAKAEANAALALALLIDPNNADAKALRGPAE